MIQLSFVAKLGNMEVTRNRSMQQELQPWTPLSVSSTRIGKWGRMISLCFQHGTSQP